MGAFLTSGAVVGAFPWWPIGVLALPVLAVALCGMGREGGPGVSVGPADGGGKGVVADDKAAVP